jgi:hypothetical protein
MRDWTPGQTIQNRFRILDVQSGGMANLYIAHDNHIERTVAIKTPKLSDSDAFDAFSNEARVIFSIKRSPFLINAFQRL